MGVAHNVPIQKKVGDEFLLLDEVELLVESGAQHRIALAAWVAIRKRILAQHAEQGSILGATTGIGRLILVAGPAPLFVAPHGQFCKEALCLPPNPGFKALLGALEGLPPGIPLLEYLARLKVGKGRVSVYCTQYAVELRVLGTREYAGLPRECARCLGVALGSDLLVVVHTQPLVGRQWALGRPLNGKNDVHLGMQRHSLPVRGVPYPILDPHTTHPLSNKTIGGHAARQEKDGPGSAQAPIKTRLKGNRGKPQRRKPSAGTVDFSENEARAGTPLFCTAKHLLGSMQPEAHTHCRMGNSHNRAFTWIWPPAARFRREAAAHLQASLARLWAEANPIPVPQGA